MSVAPIENIILNVGSKITRVASATAKSGKLNTIFEKTLTAKPLIPRSTSAGAPLKKLVNITDPYFGVKLIRSSELGKIEAEIEKIQNPKKLLKYLKKFRAKNLQLVEGNIYDRFLAEAKVNPDMRFEDMLKKWYPEAIEKLKGEEFKVLDEINNLSKNLSPKTMQAVREQTEKCREIIINNDPAKPFKRKTVLNALNNIQPQQGEEAMLEELKKYANRLPTSNTSENAFVVKYANRGQSEIAKRLVRASSQSIEHIHPYSLGGANNLSNFMLASSSANSLRGNMPLRDFIQQYPQVVENCQKYIDDIISVINKGGLEGYEYYPYEVARALEKESGGLIKLDLSKLKYSVYKLKAA